MLGIFSNPSVARCHANCVSRSISGRCVSGMGAARHGDEHAAMDAAQLQEKKMTAKNIIVFLGVSALSTFLVVACGESNAAERTKADELSVEDHSGHDHAAQNHTPRPTKSIKTGFDGMPAPGSDAYCPVMKHDFKVTADSTFSVHDGKTYVFCCPACKPKFEADPAKYIYG